VNKNIKKIKTIKDCSTAITLPIAIVILVWLPFGFQLGGLIEEWDILGLFSEHGLFFIASSTSPLAAHALRPLTVLPHAIAFWLNPYSFDFWNVILMIALVIKGVGIWLIIKYTTGSKIWAGVAAVLLLLYPADTMQLSFRSLHINLALGILLIACALTLSAYENRSGRKSWLLSLGGSVLLIVSLCMYEAGIMFMALPYFCVWSRLGYVATRNLIWKNKRQASIWITGGMIYIIYAYIVSKMVSSYQADVASGINFNLILGSFTKLFSTGVLHALIGGWWQAFNIVSLEYQNYAYLFAGTAFLTGFTLLTGTQKTFAFEANYDPEKCIYMRMFTSGLIMSVLGYAPYLASPAHLAISQRTFLYAAPGAVLAWISILMIFQKKAKWISLVVIFGMFFIGFGNQLYQLHHYITISDKQKEILSKFVDKFKGKQSDENLLIIDKTNQLGQTWMILPGTLPYILNYLYNQKFEKVDIVRYSGMEWQKPDALGRKGKLNITAEGYKLTSPEAVEGPGYTANKLTSVSQLIKEKTKIIEIDSLNKNTNGEQEHLYDKALNKGSSLQAMRHRKLLNPQPWPYRFAMFKDQIVGSTYRWDFGRWWSMEVPIRGSGWREAEWSGDWFRHNASAWKTSECATLEFEINPDDSPYILKGQLQLILNEKIKQSIKIHINNQEIPFSINPNNMFTAAIPSGLLKKGLNNIMFFSEIDKSYYGLSFQLDWLLVEPQS
jgi:hypothetical protein